MANAPTEPLDRVAEVEARSAGFRRELGLGTLALTQIMYVVGSAWVGAAEGSAHLELGQQREYFPSPRPAQAMDQAHPSTISSDDDLALFERLQIGDDVASSS